MNLEANIDQADEASSARCSFCLKSAKDVGVLIDGPPHDGEKPAMICRDCVELCKSLFEQAERSGTTALNPEAFGFDANALQQKLNEVLASLTQLERTVVELRFGLLDGHSYTVEEICRRLDLAPESIRSLEERAMERLERDRTP